MVFYLITQDNLNVKLFILFHQFFFFFFYAGFFYHPTHLYPSFTAVLLNINALVNLKILLQVCGVNVKVAVSPRSVVCTEDHLESRSLLFHYCTFKCVF